MLMCCGCKKGGLVKKRGDNRLGMVVGVFNYTLLLRAWLCALGEDKAGG